MPGHYDDCACETCYPKVKTTSAKFADRILTLVDVNKALLKSGVFEAVCLEIEEAGREALDKMAWGTLQKEARAEALTEGRKQGLEEAAKVALETNLNVHPECGRAVAFCIRALKEKV